MTKFFINNTVSCIFSMLVNSSICTTNTRINIFNQYIIITYWRNWQKSLRIAYLPSYCVINLINNKRLAKHTNCISGKSFSYYSYEISSNYEISIFNNNLHILQTKNFLFYIHKLYHNTLTFHAQRFYYYSFLCLEYQY